MADKLSKKQVGGISNILGNDYEADFFVEQLVYMLFPINNSDNIREVERQKKTYIDDVFVRFEDGRSYYYQCKRYIRDKNIFQEFIIQYLTKKPTEMCLLSQSKDFFKDTAELAKLVNIYDYKTFLKKVENDKKLKAALKFIKDLIEVYPKRKNNSRKTAYDFLKTLKIEAHDETSSLKSLTDRMISLGYTQDTANRIYDHFKAKSDKREWLAKALTKQNLVNELKKINIEYKPQINIQKSSFPGQKENIQSKEISKVKIRRKTSRSNELNILDDSRVTFYEKLSFIKDFIANLDKPRKIEREQILRIISKNDNLAWHFFRNLKNPAWFPLINSGLIKQVCGQTNDHAVRYQLLSYFESCFEKYSNTIIPLLITFEKNTKNYDILSKIIKTISKIKPSNSAKLNPIWNLLEKLAKHQHAWVRKEIPDTLKVLYSYNPKRALRILEKLFLYTPTPQNIVRGSATLSLQFQGRDNENMVFEGGTRALRELMAIPKYAIDCYSLAISLEKKFLLENNKSLEKEYGIALDYSHIWFDDSDSDQTDYEYDKKKRFAIEIERGLEVYAKNNEDVAKKLIAILLNAKIEVFYLSIIRVLTKYSERYKDIIENIALNESLWKIHGIRVYNLQLLIGKYLQFDPNKTANFIGRVDNLKSNWGKEKMSYIRQDLLSAIPKTQKTDDIKNRLMEFEIKLNTSSKIKRPFVITSWSGPRPGISIEDLKKKNNEELVSIMEEASNDKRRSDAYDLAPSIGILIQESINRFFPLLDTMSGKSIAPNFTAEMIRAYIEQKKESITDVIRAYRKLRPSDCWARMEIARYLKEKCKNKQIVKIDHALLKEIKEVVIAFTQDTDPKDDETMKSSNPRPEDAITRGLNSVRGIATETLCLLLYYYPSDKEIATRLIELSDDRTNTVKATILYNLKYLWVKKNDFCKNLVNKFRAHRDPEIDFALISYFASLNPTKFALNKGFVELLFNSSNTTIQGSLGKLIGYRILAGFKVDDLAEAIVKQQIGSKECLRSLAFVFESQLPKLINEKKYRKVLGYYLQLLSPQNELEVVERASFLFERDELKPEYLPLIIKSKLPEELFKSKNNILAQYHFINYLYRCITNQKLISICVRLLNKQTKLVNDVFNDQLIAQKIAEIVRKVFQSKINKQTHHLIEEIFDMGLERGWDEFYKIFDDFYSNAN